MSSNPTAPNVNAIEYMAGFQCEHPSICGNGALCNSCWVRTWAKGLLEVRGSCKNCMRRSAGTWCNNCVRNTDLEITDNYAGE